MKKRKSGAKHCHYRVRDVAKEMAGAVYEKLAGNDDWYTLWKADHPKLTGEALQIAFIDEKWPQFLESARSTLTKMLTTPIAEDLKEEIYTVLLQDNLIRQRGPRSAWRQ